MTAADAAPIRDADQSPRNAGERQAISSTVVLAVGSLVAGCAINWWISAVQETPVYSDADLDAVRFGVPIPWITQNQSPRSFTDYPQAVRLLLPRGTGVTAPTDVDWVAFAGGSLIWGAVAWTVAAVAVPFIVQAVRARTRARSRTSRA